MLTHGTGETHAAIWDGVELGHLVHLRLVANDCSAFWRALSPLTINDSATTVVLLIVFEQAANLLVKDIKLST